MFAPNVFPLTFAQIVGNGGLVWSWFSWIAMARLPMLSKLLPVIVRFDVPPPVVAPPSPTLEEIPGKLVTWWIALFVMLTFSELIAPSFWMLIPLPSADPEFATP